MNIETFEQDLLELRSFAVRLERFIEVEHQFVSGSLVVALSSKFGSGKTTFLRMWQDDLSTRTGKPAPLIIPLNAWESDYYGDPLFAIVGALVEHLPKSEKSRESMASAAKKLGRFGLAIGNQIARTATGIDAIEAGKFAEADPQQILAEDAFSIFQARKTAMQELKSTIRDFVKSSDPRVLFLVDELDRCRPDYAIAYLETIKHIFDIQGAVFVLAADRLQLENSAKVAFGSGLDFDEYLRKFVHREVALPRPTEQGYRKITQAYVTQFLNREGIRRCAIELNNHQIENIVMLVGGLRLTPRQIQEIFRLLGHTAAAEQADNRCLGWGIAIGTIIMAAFKVGKSDIYILLANGSLDPKRAITLLEETIPHRSIDWWIVVFICGKGLKLQPNESVLDVLKGLGLATDKHRLHQDFDENRWLSGWLGGDFCRIYEKLEHVDQWLP
jgi:hypothetical protein